jgi:hypothetical protein
MKRAKLYERNACWEKNNYYAREIRKSFAGFSWSDYVSLKNWITFIDLESKNDKIRFPAFKKIHELHKK